jgi:hypothetical protein
MNSHRDSNLGRNHRTIERAIPSALLPICHGSGGKCKEVPLIEQKRNGKKRT